MAKDVKDDARRLLRRYEEIDDSMAGAESRNLRVGVERVIELLSTAGLLHKLPTHEEWEFALAHHGHGMHESYMAGQSWARWAYKYLTGREEQPR